MRRRGSGKVAGAALALALALALAAASVPGLVGLASVPGLGISTALATTGDDRISSIAQEGADHAADVNDAVAADNAQDLADDKRETAANAEAVSAATEGDTAGSAGGADAGEAAGDVADASSDPAAVAIDGELVDNAEQPEDDGSWLEEGNAVNPQQLPDSSFIYDTSILDLSTADAYFNQQTVQVTGEAVGDSIRNVLDRRHRWITLSSEGDSATVAVFMTAESAAKIDTFGRYGSRGTTLQVRGTFYLACPDHDGVTDLHAEVVTVVEPGEVFPEEFDPESFIPGAVGIVVGLLMSGLLYWIRERRR